LLLGGLLIALALSIPWLGGAEKVVIAITALIVTPLLAPTIWGLLNQGVTQKAVWATVVICFAAGIATKFIWTEALADWGRTPEILVGVGLPVLLMTAFSLMQRGRCAGWRRIQTMVARAESEEHLQPLVADRSPAYIVAGALGVCGVLMASLIPFNQTDRGLIAIFAALLALLACVIVAVVVRQQPPATGELSKTED
jgi:hypothetical protein